MGKVGRAFGLRLPLRASVARLQAMSERRKPSKCASHGGQVREKRAGVEREREMCKPYNDLPAGQAFLRKLRAGEGNYELEKASCRANHALKKAIRGAIQRQFGAIHIEQSNSRRKCAPVR